jgi:membrane protein YdbS with pleckstrin-like domain
MGVLAGARRGDGRTQGADYRLPLRSILRAGRRRGGKLRAACADRHNPPPRSGFDGDTMASYVEKALIEGERILYLGRVSWWSLVWPHLLLGVLLMPVLIGLLFLATALIRRYATEVAVTTHRVIVKRGLIVRDTVELNIQKIESVQVIQGLLGRMFDFGTLAVAGGGNPMAAIDGIAEPLAFRRACLEAQEKAPGARVPQAA